MINDPVRSGLRTITHHVGNKSQYILVEMKPCAAEIMSVSPRWREFQNMLYFVLFFSPSPSFQPFSPFAVCFQEGLIETEINKCKEVQFHFNGIEHHPHLSGEIC